MQKACHHEELPVCQPHWLGLGLMPCLINQSRHKPQAKSGSYLCRFVRTLCRAAFLCRYLLFKFVVSNIPLWALRAMILNGASRQKQQRRFAPYHLLALRAKITRALRAFIFNVVSRFICFTKTSKFVLLKQNYLILGFMK